VVDFSGLRDSLRTEATPGKDKDMAKKGKRSRIPGTVMYEPMRNGGVTLFHKLRV
jgi:hypothetical protein